MTVEQCPDPAPHGPHTWYAPGGKGNTQQQYECPGVEKK